MSKLEWIGLGLIHFFPSLVINIDGLINSIQFYLRHLVIVIILAVLVLVRHLTLFYLGGPYQKPEYPMADWFNEPLLASIIALSVFVYLPIAFTVFVMCSRYKIRRRYKKMKFAD